MIDTEQIVRSIVIWGIISLLIAVLGIVVYLWLSKAARFENRKKEITLGMIVCVLAVASFLVLPILFSGIDLNALGKELFDSIQLAEFDAEDAGEKLKMIPFARLFAHFLAAMQYAKVIIIGAAAFFSLLIFVFVGLIIREIREPKIEHKNPYTRKHLFEYNSEIVAEVNRKK